MDDLNDKQRSAAEAGEGPVAIIAGPGTGKTKTLVARIGFLIRSGVRPEGVLALTFTKKAAGEMAGRICKTAGLSPTADAKLGTPTIATFHALCFELLREKLGKTPEFIAEPARLALIKKLSKPVVFKGVSTRELSLLISRAKNMADDTADVARLVDAYTAELAAHNLHDFDDLLVKTRDFLLADQAWRSQVQKRFTHILVDEFQDTNALQYDILQLLRGNENVFVIGDPLQSIYGFRGADGDIFARFLHDSEAAKTIILDTNYRSAARVVALANAIYPDAPALHAHNKHQGMVRAIETLNEYREADWVLSEIQKAIGGSDLQRAVSDDERTAHRTLRDFAVLYRSRSAARALQKAFEASGLPFQIVGEGSPYDLSAVQTIIQIFAKLVDADRIVTIKDMSVGQLSALIEKFDKTQTPLKLAEHIAEIFALPIDPAMRQFFGVLVRFKTIDQAVAYFDDISGKDFYDSQADAITLLTIHAAKGLEFTHVFLIGAEDGILPSARGDMAEEKRLFYVAVTRPKERLDILFTRKRGGQDAVISPFVADITHNILPRIRDDNFTNDQKKAQKRHAKSAQASLF